MSQQFDFVEAFSAETLQQLINNHVIQQPLKGTRGERDFEPVCKIFLPWGSATWLVTELDPDDGIAFGLADLGFGQPELGSFDLNEIYEVRGLGGLRMEVDIHFKAEHPISWYADDARQHGRIRA